MKTTMQHQILDHQRRAKVLLASKNESDRIIGREEQALADNIRRGNCCYCQMHERDVMAPETQRQEKARYDRELAFVLAACPDEQDEPSSN